MLQCARTRLTLPAQPRHARPATIPTAPYGSLLAPRICPFVNTSVASRGYSHYQPPPRERGRKATGRCRVPAANLEHLAGIIPSDFTGNIDIPRFAPGARAGPAMPSPSRSFPIVIIPRFKYPGDSRSRWWRISQPPRALISRSPGLRERRRPSADRRTRREVRRRRRPSASDTARRAGCFASPRHAAQENPSRMLQVITRGPTSG